MEENKHWSSHVEWFMLMITVIGCAYHVNNLTDSKVTEIRQEVIEQSKRTDRLYEIIVQNQKELQDLFREMHGRILVLEDRQSTGK